jgi:outer membrane protein OmpU
MKKILLATTLLAMTAGYASAEVAVSGSARMGVNYNGTDSVFTSRVRIGFAGSGTTDGGLTFGASMRADQSGGNGGTLTTTGLDTVNVGDTGTTNGSSTVFIAGSFGKLTMGDVAGGASDNLVGQVSGIGFTGLGDNNEIGFLGGDATAVRYDFTSGPFSISVGAGQTTSASKAKSIAVSYAAGSYAVALGYSDVTGDNQIDAKGSASFGPVKATLRLAKRDSAADMAESLSLDYTMGAMTITAFATQNHDFAATDTTGLGAKYDLGGGAVVAGGFADNGTDTIAEVGINLSF